jgi:hypothetical protein
MLRRIFVLLVLAILATNVSATSQIRRGRSCRTGQIVIKPKFEPGLSFSEGLAVVWKNDQSSYIDTAGAIVSTFLKARWSFSDGLTVIGEYPGRVYVDKRGKTVAPYEVGSEF